MFCYTILDITKYISESEFTWKKSLDFIDTYMSKKNYAVFFGQYCSDVKKYFNDRGIDHYMYIPINTSETISNSGYFYELLEMVD